MKENESLTLKETDLNDPIKHWLAEQGCDVKAEVRGVDLLGFYGEDLLIGVELKIKLNLEVINQAVERQSFCDMVYVAVVHDYKMVETKRYKMTLLTLKRLNLGLLLVNFRATTPYVIEVIKPESFDFELSRKRKASKRQTVLKEFNKRQGDFNKGGSTKQKLMTAYKEQCLLILYLMFAYDLTTTKALQEHGFLSKQVMSIWNKNFYNWFVKLDKGVYAPSEEGVLALSHYKDVIEFLLEKRVYES